MAIQRFAARTASAATGGKICYERRPTLLPRAVGDATNGMRRCCLRSRALLPLAGRGVPSQRWCCHGGNSATLRQRRCYLRSRAVLPWAVNSAPIGRRCCCHGRQLCYPPSVAVMSMLKGGATMSGQRCSRRSLVGSAAACAQERCYRGGGGAFVRRRWCCHGEWRVLQMKI